MKTKQQKEKTIEMFEETLSNTQWCSIEGIVSEVEKNSDLAERLLSGDIRKQALKHACRQLIKRLKNEDGLPRFASIVEKDESGNEMRVYKQETLFNLDDYVQVVKYHSNRVLHHAQMASHYKKEYESQTSEQLHLPFDESAIFHD